MLTDIVAPDLRVLLVAINPAPLSAERGEHFATPTNGFWPLLHRSGLTSRLFRPDEASRLVEEGIGLTSLVERPTRTAAELPIAERRQGAERLRETVERYRPRVVALVGLTLFPVVFPDADEPGPGMKKVRLGASRVFVLPNPSGRNRAYPGVVGKLPWFSELSKALASRGRRSPSTGNTGE